MVEIRKSERARMEDRALRSEAMMGQGGRGREILQRGLLHHHRRAALRMFLQTLFRRIGMGGVETELLADIRAVDRSDRPVFGAEENVLHRGVRVQSHGVFRRVQETAFRFPEIVRAW